LRRSGEINEKRFVRTLRVIVLVPVEAQVTPFGIERFDQGHLLFPPPALDLSLDCVADVPVLLEVHQAFEPVLTGKAWDRLVLVFVITPLDVIGNANVQAPHTPRHDIDPVALHHVSPVPSQIASR